MINTGVKSRVGMKYFYSIQNQFIILKND